MSYAVRLEVDSPERIANWRPLVQWLLAIPHFVVLWFVNVVASIAMVVSWFAILFTGRLPAGAARFISFYIRYTTRVTMYAGFLHEEYPPFDLTPSVEEPGGTPVRVDINAELEERNRMTVAFRLIVAIPALIFATVLYYGAQIIWLVSVFIVLFTGQWNEPMREFVLKASRVYLRATVYTALLTDEYPPFTLD